MNYKAFDWAVIGAIAILGMVIAYQQGFERGYITDKPQPPQQPSVITVLPPEITFTNVNNVHIEVILTNTVNVIQIPSDIEIPDDTDGVPTLNDGTFPLNATNGPVI
jgi:hypothetical protein